MNVAAILKEKGRYVATTGPESKMLEVANALLAKRIGAIVVVDADESLVGIISERDFVRMIGNKGMAAMELSAREVMTKTPLTCSETDTLGELMKTMTNERVRHLPVVDDSGLIGIVSIGDVVKHHVSEVEMEASAMRDYIATG